MVVQEDLDKQSDQLYQKLDNLKEGLQKETAEFEEQKELELSELLLLQQKFAGEFKKSQVYNIFCFFTHVTSLFFKHLVQSRLLFNQVRQT